MNIYVYEDELTDISLICSRLPSQRTMKLVKLSSYVMTPNSLSSISGSQDSYTCVS